MNRRVTIGGGALFAMAALLVAGCGAEPAPAPPAVTAQQDLRPPVRAVVELPDTPVSLTLQGGSAPVDPVKTDINGTLLPPQDISRLGWWADSAMPGSGQGTVVFTGHVDDAKQGAGFAKRVSGLKAGDRLTITTRSGKSLNYQIDSVVSVSKKGGLPTAQLNQRQGPETLALITCGGGFVGPPLGYANNDIAWARPVA